MATLVAVGYPDQGTAEQVRETVTQRSAPGWEPRSGTSARRELTACASRRSL